ncbi:MAG: ubiquinone/menaquinone biosynthesis C-methylase UbiE [Bacteroidia bacterium]|jgi:ubiquinone/menaquinone biosynthesis C-methylase UbiE
MSNDYLEINKALWNKKTLVHVDSEFYNNPAFLDGQTSLKEIELALLGDITGLKVLHLQCHFGQDTISLSRLGAQVTGVDFSEMAIDKAQEMNTLMKETCHFICSDVYRLPEVLNNKFDLVFTTYGTIGWLPDMKKWAGVVSHFLKPSGRLILVDFHPALWMFDNDFTHVQYRYFNNEPIIEAEEGTYADKSASIKKTSINWNHSFGEILSAMKINGLQLDDFQEFDYSPYPCFDHSVETEPGKHRIQHLGNKIPMCYAITADKK